MPSTYQVANLKAKKIQLDASVEFIADQYAVDMADTAVFRNAQRLDTVSVDFGLVDAGGVARTVGHITGGPIDEYQVQFTPTSVVSKVRGRDPAAFLLDRYYSKLYKRPPGAQVAPLSQLPLGVFIGPLAAAQVPTVIGWFNASEIARDVCHFVGLDLSWEVRDYELLEDFNATGRASEILRKLVEPWQQVEPYRADLYVQGSTVLIRYRQTPAGRGIVPQYIFSMQDARQSSLSIRKRPLKKIGLVTLRGSSTSSSLIDSRNVRTTGLPQNDPNKGTAAAVQGSELMVTIGSATNDAAGNPVSLVANAITYRMPDMIVVKQVRSTYTIVPNPSLDAAATVAAAASRAVAVSLLAATPVSSGGSFQLTTIETVDSDWEDSVYGPTGRLNNPKHLADHTSRQTLNPNPTPPVTVSSPDITPSSASATEVPLPSEASVTAVRSAQTGSQLILDSTEDHEFSYDPNGFLQQESLYKTNYDPSSGQVSSATIEATSHTDIDTLVVARVKNTYSLNTGVQPNIWALTATDTTIQGGKRPGGPGRQQPKSTRGASNVGHPAQGAGLEELLIRFVISSDPDAVPFNYTNRNLQLADLQFIQQMLLAAAIFQWEYEVQFGGPMMPWLRKGVSIQFTGLTIEDGRTQIGLPPLIVTQTTAVHDQSKQQAEQIQRVRAFAWSAT